MYKTRKFVTAKLHWKQGLLCDDELRSVMLTSFRNFTIEELSYQNVTDVFHANSGDVCGIPYLTCDGSEKYRRHNGTCNNLIHPSWGSRGIPHKHLVTVEYGLLFCYLSFN